MLTGLFKSDQFLPTLLSFGLLGVIILLPPTEKRPLSWLQDPDQALVSRAESVVHDYHELSRDIAKTRRQAEALTAGR